MTYREWTLLEKVVQLAAITSIILLILLLVLILARESGLQLQLSEMHVQNLVSDEKNSPALSCSIDEFLRVHLPNMDEKWEKEKVAFNNLLFYSSPC